MSAVVVSSRRVGLVNEALNSPDRGVIFQADEGTASASRSLVQPDLLVGHVDRRPAPWAVDLSQDVIKLAGHSRPIARTYTAENIGDMPA